MSSLPYVHGGHKANPSIQMETLRAPHLLSARTMSEETDPNPPSHHVHAHDPRDPHFYEGREPGLDGEHGAKASVQYDTLVDKDKNPYLREKNIEKQHEQEQRTHHHDHDHDGESSGDETEDFDWNTDDSDMDEEVDGKGQRVIRAKRGRRAWLALMRLARPVRIFVFGALGTAIFMVPFIVMTTAFRDSPARPEVQTWSIWISIIWAAACGTFLVLDWLPPLILKVGVAFYGKAPPMFKTYVEVLIAINIWIKLVLCIVWAWISLGGIVAIEFRGVPTPRYFSWIFRVIRALFASGVILIAEKFALQLVAINFHKVSLKERLEVNEAGLKALDRLADSKYLASGVNSRRGTGTWGKSFHFGTGSRPQSPGANTALGHHKNGSHVGDASTGGYFQQQPHQQHPLAHERGRDDAKDSPPKKRSGSRTPLKKWSDKDQRKSNFAAQLTDALQTATMKGSKLYRNDRMLSARRMAKKLFLAVGHHRSSLTAEDFEPFFDTPAEAREAFKHFDFDDNGDITREEFRDGVQRIFRERRALATSLKDASSAVRKLDSVLLGVALVIMVFIWLLIFNGNNTVANIAPLSTFVIGFSFIFGNSAKTIFESMVFIFATHPYDVGDLVCVDDTFFYVVSFGMISTTFRTTMNETIVAPNALLSSSKLIYNCRRSGNQWEVTNVQVGYDSTLLEVIDDLRARMRTWVKAHDREWGGGLEINLNEFDTSANSIDLIVAMEHKGNWQNWGERWARRTQLMRQLKTELEDLGVTYQLPKQPVSFTQASSHAPHRSGAPRMPHNQPSTISSSLGGAVRGAGGLVPVGGQNIGKPQLSRKEQLAALSSKK